MATTADQPRDLMQKILDLWEKSHDIAKSERDLKNDGFGLCNKTLQNGSSPIKIFHFSNAGSNNETMDYARTHVNDIDIVLTCQGIEVVPDDRLVGGRERLERLSLSESENTRVKMSKTEHPCYVELTRLEVAQEDTPVSMDSTQLASILSQYIKVVFSGDEAQKSIIQIMFNLSVSDIVDKMLQMISENGRLRSDKMMELFTKIVGSILSPDHTSFSVGSAAVNFFDHDVVLTFPCPQWPLDVEQKFLERKRNWPSDLEVKLLITKGCHVVPKAYYTGDGHDWRLSFSNAEGLLFRFMNTVQHAVFLLSKLLLKEIKNSFSEPEKDLVSSYCLKTCLFWEIEERDVDWWVKSNFIECLMSLLKRLVASLTKYELRHFFVVDSNILERYSQMDCAKFADKLEGKLDTLGKDPLHISKRAFKILALEDLCQGTSIEQSVMIEKKYSLSEILNEMAQNYTEIQKSVSAQMMCLITFHSNWWINLYAAVLSMSMNHDQAKEKAHLIIDIVHRVLDKYNPSIKPEGFDALMECRLHYLLKIKSKDETITLLKNLMAPWSSKKTKPSQVEALSVMYLAMVYYEEENYQEVKYILDLLLPHSEIGKHHRLCHVAVHCDEAKMFPFQPTAYMPTTAHIYVFARFMYWNALSKLNDVKAMSLVDKDEWVRFCEHVIGTSKCLELKETTRLIQMYFSENVKPVCLPDFDLD